MKNNIYFNNISILKNSQPDVYGLITNDKEEISDNILDIKILKTNSRLPTLEIKFPTSKITIHSKINPLIEINRIINSKLSGGEDTIIVIGFGLGYLVERIISKNPDAMVFVYEPSLKILKKALKTRDLSNIFKHEKLRIVVGSANIDSIVLETHAIYNPVLLHIRGYKVAFPDFTRKIIESYNEYLQKNSINIATLKRFDRLWTKNSFKNSVHFFTKPGLSLLNNFFSSELGALVIGAGPSIEKDYQNIKRLKENYVLISVDTAFRPLIKNEIIPDFVVSVDPQYINSLSLNPSFYSGIDPEKLPILILDPAVYPTTLRNYPGRIILTSSIFPPGKIIENFSGYKGKIAAGGSVAVTAFDFARIIGADPIILLGLDLSYQNNLSHARGSFVDHYRIIIQDRFSTQQSQFVKYLMGGTPIETKNNLGVKCYTDKRMLLYKSWFEKNIPSSKSSILNATRGGLKLTGAKSSKLDDIEHDAIARQKSSFLTTLLHKIDNTNIPYNNTISFLKYLKKIERNISRMLNLAKEARSILLKMKNENSFAEYNIKLSDIDKKIISFRDEIKLISMTMQDLVVKIMKDSGVQKREKIIEESENLYGSIEESSKFLLKIIKNTKIKLNFLISEFDN